MHVKIRQKNALLPNDSKVSPGVENGAVSIMKAQVPDEVEDDVDIVRDAESSSSTAFAWSIGNSDAPHSWLSLTNQFNCGFVFYITCNK